MTRYLVERPLNTVEVLLLPNKDGSGYQYINLTKGQICPCKFKTEFDAVLDMNRKMDEGSVIRYKRIGDIKEQKNDRH